MNHASAEAVYTWAHKDGQTTDGHSIMNKMQRSRRSVKSRLCFWEENVRCSISCWALDIDGTLVNSEGKITPRVKQAIRQAVDAGCHVMLRYRPLLSRDDQIQEESGLTVPCMVYGGAQIVDNGKRLYEVSIDPETTYECMQWANENGFVVEPMGRQLLFLKNIRRTATYMQRALA